jgi:hypothetical protein
MHLRTLALASLASFLPAAGTGCGPTLPQAPRTLPSGASDGLARCKVAASQDRPLVTEWPASEKANLEARLSAGPVVVAYSGCNLRILNDCKVSKGRYVWQKTTLANDTVEIRNADELYAKLPLGAASLEGELQASGRLAVQTSVAGQMTLEGVGTADVPRADGCADATHVISAVTVGAFKLKSGGELSASAGASVAGVGSTGGSSKSSETLMREAGDASKCGDATDAKADPACRTPVQLFLSRLPKLVPASGAAGPASGGATSATGATGAVGGDEGVPGAVLATFGTDRGDKVYDVIIDGKEACKTPCTRWIGPERYVVVQRLGAGGFSEALPRLEGSADQGPIKLVPHGPSLWRVVAGGGSMALGVPTSVVGLIWMTSEVEKARAFGVPLLVGGLSLLSVGTWLLVGSGAGFTITKAENNAARLDLGPGYAALRLGRGEPVRVLLTPGGLAGSF